MDHELCLKCNLPVEGEISSHNCEYSKKFKVLEDLLTTALEENKSLKNQNEDMKKNIMTIKAEMTSSFTGVKDVLSKINI